MKRLLLFILLTSATAGVIFAQEPAADEAVTRAVADYFSRYAVPGYTPNETMRADSVTVDEEARTVCVHANEAFCAQPMIPADVARILRDISVRLPQPYNAYRLTVVGKGGRDLSDYVPNELRGAEADRSRLWGNVDYKGQPWVKNASRPFSITKGLSGRHLMINASHGRYYRDGEWRWQRPYIFCTTEDLFTQSFVFPYLIPMLENAGAVVATARERDDQTFEAVVDNDDPQRQGIYTEAAQDGFQWMTVSGTPGFAAPQGLLNDSTQPFLLGTARQIAATSRRSKLSTATWSPRLPAAGRYAVYVSYTSRPNSVNDASYTVYHSGGRTQFRVNQQMGGGTWVYLGTFDFPAGESRESRVVLTNHSNGRGVVTADGVRFGGGVGQTERGEAGTSGLPRRLEGARYQAWWSGLPDSLCHRDDGTNDYNDDIRARSFLLNHLGGGSVYMPSTEGLGVPFELALAVHTDAGVRRDGSIYGTLGICKSDDGAGNHNYPGGISRQASSDFISSLMTSVTEDMTRTFGTQWTRRELWDRNYGECRTPDVPSAILEMFSHQNFADMKFGHDPTAKFAMSRAIYKGILRFVNYEHGIDSYDVQPLPVHAFAATLTTDGNALLTWKATADTLCDNAAPTAYVVYTKIDDEGFDNGQVVEGGKTSLTIPVSRGRQYSFRVTAINRGGESFPSETLTLRRGADGSKHILIVNGFDRLSGPAVIETTDSVGFLLDEDMGVADGSTWEYAGRQLVFDPATVGMAESQALGYSGHEMEGRKVIGNTFDYPTLHGRAIAASTDCSFSSCSRAAFTDGSVEASGYDMVDYIAGLQRDAAQNLRSYKVFDAATRRVLTRYVKGGGSVFVSGSYVGTDLATDEERAFAADVLKYAPAGTARTDSTGTVRGLNLSIPIRRERDGAGYVVQSPDKIVPTSDKAFTAFAYAGGGSAGTAYAGSDGRAIVTGFPFESITDAETRRLAMGAIITFLTK